MSANSINRRRHERIGLRPMYTAITVRTSDGEMLEGHAYDISEGGVQFELDYPIAPGSVLAMSLELPQFDGEPIRLSGNVVWLDVSEPGPARMALAVTRFEDESHKARLIGALGRGRVSRAA